MMRLLLLLLSVLVAFVAYELLPENVHHSEDELFGHYDYIGVQPVESGKEFPVPFHCYDADSTIFHGLSDPAAWEDHMSKQDWHLITDKNTGKIPTLVWIVKYKETTADSYLEMLVTTFVSKEKKTVDWVGPISSTRLMFFEPGSKNYVYKLWLNETDPIDYGREILGYDKYPTHHTAHIDVTEGVATSWNFPTADGKDSLFEGVFALKTGFDHLVHQLKQVVQLYQVMGVKKAVKALTDTDFKAPVVTPKGVMDPSVFPSDRNPIGEFIAKVNPKFYEWNPETDHFTFHEADLKNLGIDIKGVQNFPNIRFVLKGPYNHIVKHQ